MIVWKDCFTGDELLSDAMKNVRMLADGLIVACESYNITPGNEDYGIENNDEDGGAAGGDGTSESVNVVVDAFKLQNIPMTKKDFTSYIKRYSKRVKENLEKVQGDRVEPFMAGMKMWVPEMLKDFDNYDFYMGPSCDPDALLVLAKYEGEAMYPTFMYIRDGLVEEKF